MSTVVLQCTSAMTSDPCGLCGRPTRCAAGTQLTLAEGAGPVCADCGRRQAPSLVALVHLARAAERVGRMGRHSVFPSMTALLDALSAETLAVPRSRRRWVGGAVAVGVVSTFIVAFALRSGGTRPEPSTRPVVSAPSHPFMKKA